MDRLKILVVDDESRMRKLVRDFLVKSNFEVLEAGDGEEALDIFYKDKDIALIILDVMMPKMDGWQVCREFQALQSQDPGGAGGSDPAPDEPVRAGRSTDLRWDHCG